MRIFITNEVVTKDGVALNDVFWADTEQGEACIFCHDRNGTKIPTDTDPSGYETLVIKGQFTVTKSTSAAQASPAQPSFEWDCFGMAGYPNCVARELCSVQSMGTPPVNEALQTP